MDKKTLISLLLPPWMLVIMLVITVTLDFRLIREQEGLMREQVSSVRGTTQVMVLNSELQMIDKLSAALKVVLEYDTAAEARLGSLEERLRALEAARKRIPQWHDPMPDRWMIPTNHPWWSPTIGTSQPFFVEAPEKEK